MVLRALGALVLGGGAAFGACAGLCGAPAAPHWKVVGGVGDGRSVRFAEVDAAYAGDRATYEDAARTLCRMAAPLRHCATAFVLPGDRVPSPRSQLAGTPGGAERPSAPIAVLWRDAGQPGDFHARWNCARAPVLSAIDGACRASPAP